MKTPDPKAEAARLKLLKWDFVLDKGSVEAGIYVAWEKNISAAVWAKVVPEKGRKYIKSIPLSKVIKWVTEGNPLLGRDASSRNQFLANCLSEAISTLEQKLGPDMTQWYYGQPAYHQVLIKHPLSNAVDEVTRNKLEVGPLPRGGNGATPGMTTNNLNQTAGASFRIAVDTHDWDKTMFTNAPGQSGDPNSPFYRNLFEWWANDKHFPVYFSRPMVEKSSRERVVLNPE